MKALSLAAAATLTAALAPHAQAADLEITIQNLSRGLYFTPLLVATHPAGTRLFTSGQPASNAIQTMAEGGDIAGLESDVQSIGGTAVANPAGGLLGPAQSTTATSTGGAGTANTQLSVVAMILPSNDGFIGLNAITVPTEPGTYTYDVPVYDAGTEGNDELRGSGQPGQPGMPVPPPLDPLLGQNGSGLGDPAEGFVHIHRGNLGDTDPAGGASDIDSRRHRWLSPAARVTLTVR